MKILQQSSYLLNYVSDTKPKIKEILLVNNIKVQIHLNRNGFFFLLMYLHIFLNKNPKNDIYGILQVHPTENFLSGANNKMLVFFFSFFFFSLHYMAFYTN
jgi:hypothetical protein